MVQTPRITKEVLVDAHEIDAFTPSLSELFFVRNPQLRKGSGEAEGPLKEFLAKPGIEPVWVYYEKGERGVRGEKGVVVKSLPEAEYLELRTARNRNIITNEEQLAYRNCTVGIAGLSVGSAILRTLVMTGGPKRMKLADPDTLEVSNLNRLNASLHDVGRNKTDIAAERVWETDPFAELELWDKGVAAENLESFLTGEKGVPGGRGGRLDVFIDAMDAIPLKIQSRMLAKQHRLPVIMATDNGDGVLLDVERFDEEPGRPLFNGLVDEKDLDSGSEAGMTREMWVRLATKIVGPEYLPERMQQSIKEIGKTLSAVPQLGSSAEVAGAAVAYAVRRIANKQPMPSGRYKVSLEEMLQK